MNRYDVCITRWCILDDEIKRLIERGEQFDTLMRSSQRSMLETLVSQVERKMVADCEPRLHKADHHITHSNYGEAANHLNLVLIELLTHPKWVSKSITGLMEVTV